MYEAHSGSEISRLPQHGKGAERLGSMCMYTSTKYEKTEVALVTRSTVTRSEAVRSRSPSDAVSEECLILS